MEAPFQVMARGAGGDEVFGDIIDLGGGCVCCSVRADFVVALEVLMKRRKFDYIFVVSARSCPSLSRSVRRSAVDWLIPGRLRRCSGSMTRSRGAAVALAVARRAQTQRSGIYLDGIVGVVDAKHLQGHLRNDSPNSVIFFLVAVCRTVGECGLC